MMFSVVFNELRMPFKTSRERDMLHLQEPGMDKMKPCLNVRVVTSVRSFQSGISFIIQLRLTLNAFVKQLQVPIVYS